MNKNKKISLVVIVVLFLLASLYWVFNRDVNKVDLAEEQTLEQKELDTLESLGKRSNFSPTSNQEQLDIMSRLGASSNNEVAP